MSNPRPLITDWLILRLSSRPQFTLLLFTCFHLPLPFLVRSSQSSLQHPVSFQELETGSVPKVFQIAVHPKLVKYGTFYKMEPLILLLFTCHIAPD